jgi:tRNA-modifying protein YgfZ
MNQDPAVPVAPSANIAPTAPVLAVGFDPAPLHSVAQALGGLVTDPSRGPQVTRQGAVTNQAPCLLTEYGVVSITGADAGSFLQAQLTNDVTLLANNTVQLTGFCTAKGRLLASGWLWRQHAEHFVFLTHRALAAGLAKRLMMFVMRAKVKVVDQTAQWLVLGYFSPCAESLKSAVLPNQSQRLFALLEIDRLAQLQQNWQSSESWFLADCQAGLPWITPATSEKFVPQMVSFDLREGVSFKKGCYPGQEVVARSHYLGKAKRRLFLGYVDSAQVPSIGADVFAADGQPVGQVIQYAQSGMPNSFAILFECQIASVQEVVAGAAALTLGALTVKIASTQPPPSVLA